MCVDVHAWMDGWIDGIKNLCIYIYLCTHINICIHTHTLFSVIFTASVSTEAACPTSSPSARGCSSIVWSISSSPGLASLCAGVGVKMKKKGKSIDVWMCVNVCEYIYRYVWICVDVYRYVWMCMNVYVCIWMCMDVYGYVWTRMDVHGCVWMCVDVHECVCMCMHVCGCVRMCVNVHGCVIKKKTP
jgi:hypothetical protein